jgi:hypothetical protein
MKPGTLLWTVVLCLSVILNMQAQDHSLQLHYTFNTSTNQVPDMSANHYDAQLMNQAGIRTLDTVQVLDLGDQNGYLDMGTSVGALIAGLEDFSITTAIYIDESSNITGNGNFVWVFSTSPACGQYTGKYIAYRVNRQRYALSTGGYNNEVAAVETGTASRKGSWYQLTYTQRGSKGSLYIDSTEVRSSSSLAYTPKDIGQATEYNWIGRPHFSSDAYLKNTLISDFRIYNRALSVEEIKALSGKSPAECCHESELLKEGWQKLSLADTTDITFDIQLPLSAAGEIVISWVSSHPDIISHQGHVVRPAAGSDTARVLLTASLSKGNDTLYKSFEISVLPFFSPEISVQRDLEALPFSELENIVKYKLHLPSAGAEGSSLSWFRTIPPILATRAICCKNPGLEKPMSCGICR